jgi:hypothetical protein
MISNIDRNSRFATEAFGTRADRLTDRYIGLQKFTRSGIVTDHSSTGELVDARGSAWTALSVSAAMG